MNTIATMKQEKHLKAKKGKNKKHMDIDDDDEEEVKALEASVFTVPALIARFPQVAIDGLFIRINVAEGKVFSLDNEGTEVSFDIFEEFTL